MKADIPPNFLGVIDATGFDQQFAVIVVLGKRFEGIGDAGARKTLEHFQPITFQSGIVPNPKRRVNRERVNVRQEVPRLIHHVDGGFAIGNPHMHMQPEDEISPGQQLHVAHNFLITLARRNELVAPM